MSHATIFYLPEGYRAGGNNIMGRQAAGEGFLRAAAKSDAMRLQCHSPDAAAAGHFAKQLQQAGFAGSTAWVPITDPGGLAEDGCLFLPGPNLTDSAWRRATVGERAYSLCGITHTTASHLAMTAITDLLIGPVYGWDALICTSRAVRDSVRILLERQAEYLRQRLGASRVTSPQCPVIPLGVHTQDFVFNDRERITARQHLQCDAEDIVLLFVGRLSFHAKAHPQQMFTALERAAKGRKLHLVQCGWFPNEHVEKAFADAAKLLCPSVTLHYLDGRDSDARRRGWAAADIFISLSDNIQETFGLTPLEAMAAGLPVIVSDWDGYKDTVRDGVDGFRIPTITPPAPAGEPLAQRYENGTDTYDVYCGLTSQLVALDPVALSAACERLISDAALRKQMGAAGAERARKDFDWGHIYLRYQALWAELAERRRADPDLTGATLSRQRPDRIDPFAVFAGYPTVQLTQRHKISLFDHGASWLSQRHLAMNSFAKSVQLNENDCGMIYRILKDHGPQIVSAILRSFPTEKHGAVLRGLVWLAKMEAVRITLA